MVSIITVVKNGISTIERAVLSVIKQNYSDFEFIVIDGVSTDGTLDVLEKYSDKIRHIITEKDSGIYDAMNKGIEVASGDWIYFLGCDDILYNNSTLSDVFSNNLSEVDVVYGNVEFLHSHEIYDGEYDFEKLCLRSPCHQAVFYRKELFAEYGNFDINYLTASDYLLHVKTFCGGARWNYVDQIIAIYNEEGLSVHSKKDKAYYNELFKICYEYFGSRVSDLTISRVFYSLYPRFFISHKLGEDFKYLSLVIRKVGFFNLIRNFFILIFKYRIRIDKD